MSDLLTTQQVADLLNVPTSSVYQWNHTGYVGSRPWIPRVRLGRHVRYRRDDLEKFLADSLVEAGLTA